jgi:hypothetical protein
MLHAMMTACQDAGIEARGANFRDVAGDVLAHPAAEDPFVCEGAIFDLKGERAELERT